MNGRQRTGLKYLPGRCPVEAMLGVLGGGVRLEIVQLLAASGSLCTGEISNRLELAMNHVCMNLAVLREHGVLTVERCGRKRLYGLSLHMRARVSAAGTVIKASCHQHVITIRRKKNTLSMTNDDDGFGSACHR